MLDLCLLWGNSQEEIFKKKLSRLMSFGVYFEKILNKKMAIFM